MGFDFLLDSKSIEGYDCARYTFLLPGLFRVRDERRHSPSGLLGSFTHKPKGSKRVCYPRRQFDFAQ